MCVLSPQNMLIQLIAPVVASMDNDKDGKINEADLGAAMKKAGYTNIKKEQIQSIIRDIDSDKDGNIEMSEFLSAAAGLKELQIASAFTQVVTDVQTAELRGKSLGLLPLA